MCYTPFIVKDKKTGEQIPVPCGKCPECIDRRIAGWAFRLQQEGIHADSAHFITLTYDTKTIPISSAGYLTLSKRDVQLFFKRLRKHSYNINNRIKYYVCGEYGSKTDRPHYHAILFNSAIEAIQSAWDKGQVHYGTVEGASIGYTLKYMSKLRRVHLCESDDRQPEFALMSKGLGKAI